MNPVIPVPVPVPLPAPAWLVHLLQLFTFVWHLLLMNLLVGGGAMLAISTTWGGATLTTGNWCDAWRESCRP